MILDVFFEEKNNYMDADIDEKNNYMDADFEEKNGTMKVFFIDGSHEESEDETTAILGKAILGCAILGNAKNVEKLKTPTIYLRNVEPGDEPEVLVLDAPVIYLSEKQEEPEEPEPEEPEVPEEPEEVPKLNTPSIYTEVIPEPEEKVQVLETPEIYLEESEVN